MKREEYRQGIPADIRTVLPKGETKPCMRGMLDLDLYNRTGRVEMIEPFEEFVSPVIENGEEHPPNQIEWRGEMARMNANKPKKEVLEGHLRNGMTASEIGRKYDTTRATVYNWIRGYGLQGIKGQKLLKSEPVDDMVQHSPSLAEVEQFHTDVEVQELPKVEMEPFVADMENEFPPMDEVRVVCPTCFLDSDHCQGGHINGMSAEENMSDAEWDQMMSKVKIIEPITSDPEMPMTREMCEEVWQGVLQDIKSIRRVYLLEAEKSFDERFRALCAEVVGELEEEKHIE